MKSRVLLTVLMLGAMVVLVGLGTWQLQRLTWKNALIAKLDDRLNQPPLSLDAVLAKYRETRDVEYFPVRITGVFAHDKARHVYAIWNGQPGWHIHTPLKTADRTYIFVNRGFMPMDKTLPDRNPDGTVTVTGLVRLPPSTTSFFTPKNEPERNRFYWRDFSNMVASVYDKTAVTFAPFFVDERADSAAGPASGWPRAGVTRTKLPNRHLEYAITWYGLALTLAGVYAFFMISGQRNETP